MTDDQVAKLLNYVERIGDQLEQITKALVEIHEQMKKAQETRRS